MTITTLSPDFSESHQKDNLTALRKFKGVRIIDTEDFKGRKCAIIEANKKTARIQLALQLWVINNVVNRMFYNYQHVKLN